MASRRAELLWMGLALVGALTARSAEARDIGNVQAIWLDVVRVEACTESGCRVIGQGRRIELIELARGEGEGLADLYLPGGKIDQVRLILGEGSRVLVEGVEHPLMVPSGAQTGLKLVGAWPQTGGLLARLRLRLELGKNLVLNPQGYRLKPTVKLRSAGIVAQNATVVTVTPQSGGSLAVSSDFLLTVPPGAVSAPSTLWVIEEKSLGPTARYQLGPEGTTFAAPVAVRLRYREADLPVPETSLVVVHDGLAIPTSVDAAADTLSGSISHFSTVWGAAPVHVTKEIAPGVQYIDRWGVPDVHVVTIDRSRTDYELRLIADLADTGMVKVHTLTQLAASHGATVAVNGFYWHGASGRFDDEDGSFATTTILGDTLQKQYSGAETLIGLGAQNGSGLRILQMGKLELADRFLAEFGMPLETAEAGTQDPASGPDDVLDHLFGSTTTILADSQCQGQDLEDFWSAIGYSADKIVLVSTTADYSDAKISDRMLCDVFLDYGVTHAVRLDGGPSAALVVNGTLVNPQTALVRTAYFGDRNIAFGIGLVPVAAPPPPPPAGAIQLEENSSGVECFGPPEYWHTAFVGSAGRMRWTFNNDEAHGVQNHCTYGFDSLTPGRYQVQAYIPSDRATTRRACYEVWDGSGYEGIEVDQSPVFNQWVTLGVFETDGALRVSLTDLTREPWASYWVGFDAIRIVPAPGAPLGVNPAHGVCIPQIP